MPGQTEIRRRNRRKKSIRKRVVGTAERPRLTVFRSNKHTYAQVVDDTTSRAIATASTQSKAVSADSDGKKKAEQASLVGAVVAKACIAQGIKEVVFDRNGYQYHGRISAVADGARKAGLKF